MNDELKNPTDEFQKALSELDSLTVKADTEPSVMDSPEEEKPDALPVGLLYAGKAEVRVCIPNDLIRKLWFGLSVSVINADEPLLVKTKEPEHTGIVFEISSAKRCFRKTGIPAKVYRTVYKDHVQIDFEVNMAKDNE